MPPLSGLAFDNWYARLHPAFYEVVDPTPLPEPYLVAFNPDAATLLRLAPSHVRFGTFQYFAARGRTDRVRELADHVIGRHFPELDDARGDDRYRRWFGEVCRRTGALIARWMAVGFAHGVLNT